MFCYVIILIQYCDTIRKFRILIGVSKTMCEKEKDKGKTISISEDSQDFQKSSSKNSRSILKIIIDHILSIPEYARIVYFISLMFNVSVVAVIIFFLVHGFYSIPGTQYLVKDRKPRKKAQGLCMYIGMRACEGMCMFAPQLCNHQAVNT